MWQHHWHNALDAHSQSLLCIFHCQCLPHRAMARFRNSAKSTRNNNNKKKTFSLCILLKHASKTRAQHAHSHAAVGCPSGAQPPNWNAPAPVQSATQQRTQALLTVYIVEHRLQCTVVSGSGSAHVSNRRMQKCLCARALYK